MENFKHYQDPVVLTNKVDDLYFLVNYAVNDFKNLLTEEEKRHYTPWTLLIDHITEDMRRNPWISNTKYTGVTNIHSGTTIYIANDIKQHELLWIILHEFRHWIQFHNVKLYSCVNNKNVELWLDQYKDRNIAEHVLHEIHPAEVDANIYACMKMNLEYPGSKFDITPENLKLLEVKE